MRFFLGLFALLVLSNVVLFLWPDSSVNAPHVYAAKDDINPHFLRLNKEIEERYVEKKYYPTQNNSSQSVMPAVSDDCYRLGPFLYQSNYELAQAVLFNADVNFQKSKRTSKESEVYRVYLGVFTTQAEVSDARVDLKRNKVMDYFVRKTDENEYIISLGIYTTEQSALGAIKLFNGKLQNVKLKEELIVLPDSYWLHFSISEKDQVKQQLRRMDWGEQSVRLGKHECEGG